MEHWYIESHNIADLYLSEQLPAEERNRFEQHFIDCQPCLDRLEMTDHLRAGLRTITAERVPLSIVRSPIRMFPPSGHRRERAGQFSWARRVAWPAATVLLAVLPSAFLILQWKSERRGLVQVEQAASEWQRKHRESEQTTRELARDGRAREDQLSAQLARQAAELERERAARRLLAKQLNRAAEPGADVPIFALSMARSADLNLSRPINRIMLSPSAKLIVLLLELEPDAGLRSYRAAILMADGRNIWSASRLAPNSRNMLALGLDSSLFKPDTYRLTLEGVTLDGQSVPVAQYSFRALTR